MENIMNSKFVTNLKRQAEENPVVVILATAAFLTAVSKLIDAHGHHAGSTAYAKQVAHKLNKK